MTQVGNGLHSLGGYLGSELKDRGDRIAFLGDAHVTQATALHAFGNYEMLKRLVFIAAKPTTVRFARVPSYRMKCS